MRSRCRWLVLVPTQLELQLLAVETGNSVHVSLCGFGPVTAAARAAALIERLRPAAIMLCGVAGALADDLETGSAHQFRHVACYGIGAGSGSSFQTSDQIGWKQWSENSLTIGNRLPLKVGNVSREIISDLLVSTCAVSTNPNEVLQKLSVYPDGSAEDMEGFAVAAAAAMHATPVSIVRGISNRAGDRDPDNWQIEEAMKSVNELTREIIQSNS